jgi:hypothetical protein
VHGAWSRLHLSGVEIEESVSLLMTRSTRWRIDARKEEKIENSSQNETDLSICRPWYPSDPWPLLFPFADILRPHHNEQLL